MLVMPCRRCTAAISVRICVRSLASRLLSGSSSRNASGSRTSARPIATRWRCPPDSCPGRRRSSGVNSSISATRRTSASSCCSRNVTFLQREGQVLVDGEVRVQRVALEHHRDVALAGRKLLDLAITDDHPAGRELLETRDATQDRALAAARRADERDELAVVDGQVEGFERDHGRLARVHLAQSLEDDRCQTSVLLLDAGRGDRPDEPALTDQEEHDHRQLAHQRGRPSAAASR